MTTQKKLDAIYEAMADKTLSDGCEIYQKGFRENHFPYGPCFSFIKKCISEYEIIGHPVRIGDVLAWYNENNPEHLWCGNGKINGEVICREWNSLRLPIDDQSESCIDFVYSLIQK